MDRSPFIAPPPQLALSSVTCPAGDYLQQLFPLVMEKILVLLLVTLAVAYAVPDPRGIILNLVRGSLGEESTGFPRGNFFKLGS